MTAPAFTPSERRFLLLACGVVEDEASCRNRPGATPLTAEGVLALRDKLQGMPATAPEWLRIRADDDAGQDHIDWPDVFSAIDELLVWNACDGFHVWWRHSPHGCPPGTHASPLPAPPGGQAGNPRPVVKIWLASLSDAERAGLVTAISRELQQHDEFHGKPDAADEQARHILRKAASPDFRFRTAHEMAEQTCRTHCPKEGDAEVTARSFPMIHAAFETVSHDSGASAGHDSYFIPAGWAGGLAEIEAVLAAMDPDERENGFIMGEGSEVEALVARRPELAPAHKLLNAFFDDFHGEDTAEAEARP